MTHEWPAQWLLSVKYRHRRRRRCWLLANGKRSIISLHSTFLCPALANGVRRGNEGKESRHTHTPEPPLNPADSRCVCILKYERTHSVCAKWERDWGRQRWKKRDKIRKKQTKNKMRMRNLWVWWERTSQGGNRGSNHAHIASRHFSLSSVLLHICKESKGLVHWSTVEWSKDERLIDPNSLSDPIVRPPAYTQRNAKTKVGAAGARKKEKEWWKHRIYYIAVVPAEKGGYWFQD